MLRERASSIRHDLGHYPCVTLTARHVLELGQGAAKIEELLTQAVLAVVSSHPILCCGICGENTPRPQFVALPSVDIRAYVQFRLDWGPWQGYASYDDALMRLLNKQHETLFENIHEHPGWRVIVTSPQASKGQISEVDVIFKFHHGFFDGLSGLIFHKQLSRCLNSRSDLITKQIRLEPTLPLEIPPPIEDLMALPLSWGFWFKHCFVKHYLPSYVASLWPLKSLFNQGVSHTPQCFWLRYA